MIVAIASAWIFGHIRYSSAATDMLVQLTAKLGLYGDEAIEDFYLAVTLLISILIAAAVAVGVRRRLAPR